MTGWARARDGGAALEVDVVVNGAPVTRVTADRPREGGASDGFAARIGVPSQPALVCARTVAAPPLDGLVVGCRRPPFPVPIRLLTRPEAPPPTGQVASFFWVDAGGDVAKPLGSIAIAGGVALYDGEPLLEAQLSWAVTVHDPTDRPLFRSGPLRELPGPPDPVLPTRSIVVYRSPVTSNFSIHEGEGAPHLVAERLRRLPSAIRVEDVRLAVDGAGREVVTVIGRVRRFLSFRQFAHTLAVTVRPESHPGRPADVLVVEPAAPGTTAGASLGGLADQLERAICEGVKAALETG